MAEGLKAFMVGLVCDVSRLSDFIANPEKVAEEAGLSEEDRAALFSGDQNRMYYAVSGLTPPEPQPAQELSAEQQQAAQAAQQAAAQQAAAQQAAAQAAAQQQQQPQQALMYMYYPYGSPQQGQQVYYAYPIQYQGGWPYGR